MKPKQIFILVIILAAAIAAVAGYWWWQKQKQANQPFPFGGNYYKRIPDTKPTSEPSYSQECGVCGPKGLHNVEGKTCAPGLECKNSDGGMVSSVSFCVKPGESIDRCL